MQSMFIISFCIALVGFTYSEMLTQGGMLLDKLYNFLQIKLEEKHEKVFNVLINCPKCVSGQWSLWIFFLTPYFDATLKGIGLHIVFITLTIWNVLIIQKIYKWLN